MTARLVVVAGTCGRSVCSTPLEVSFPSRKAATSAASTFISVSQRLPKRPTMLAVHFCHGPSKMLHQARESPAWVVKSNDPRRDCHVRGQILLVYAEELIGARLGGVCSLRSVRKLFDGGRVSKASTEEPVYRSLHLPAFRFTAFIYITVF